MLPRTSGLLVKTCLANFAFATTTTRPYSGTLSMKTSPWRRAIRCIIARREIANAAPCNAFGIRSAGGNLMAGAVGAAWVSMVLIAVHSQHRDGTAWDKRSIQVRYSLVPSTGKTLTRLGWTRRRRRGENRR